MRTVFCPVERFLAIGSADCHWIVALLCSRYIWEMVPPLPQSTARKNCKRTNTENVQKNNATFAQFLSIFGPFLSFFGRSFLQGVIIVPKMPERSPINFNSTRNSDSGKTGS